MNDLTVYSWMSNSKHKEVLSNKRLPALKIIDTTWLRQSSVNVSVVIKRVGRHCQIYCHALYILDGRVPHLPTMSSSTFADRPLKKLVLFDVDETLTPARRVRTHFVLHSYSRLTIENVVRVTWDDQDPSGFAQEACNRFRRRLWP